MYFPKIRSVWIVYYINFSGKSTSQFSLFTVWTLYERSVSDRCFYFVFIFAGASLCWHFVFSHIKLWLWSWIHTRTLAFFYRFVACAFLFFEVKSVIPIDRYQNATSKAISLHELKKVQLQERYTLLTQDSIGHLKTLCMSVLSLVVAMESEWQRDSSSQSDKKTLAF